MKIAEAVNDELDAETLAKFIFILQASKQNIFFPPYVRA